MSSVVKSIVHIRFSFWTRLSITVGRASQPAYLELCCSGQSGDNRIVRPKPPNIFWYAFLRRSGRCSLCKVIASSKLALRLWLGFVVVLLPVLALGLGLFGLGCLASWCWSSQNAGIASLELLEHFRPMLGCHDLILNQFDFFENQPLHFPLDFYLHCFLKDVVSKLMWCQVLDNGFDSQFLMA